MCPFLDKNEEELKKRMNQKKQLKNFTNTKRNGLSSAIKEPDNSSLHYATKPQGQNRQRTEHEREPQDHHIRHQQTDAKVLKGRQTEVQGKENGDVDKYIDANGRSVISFSDEKEQFIVSKIYKDATKTLCLHVADKDQILLDLQQPTGYSRNQNNRKEGQINMRKQLEKILPYLTSKQENDIHHQVSETEIGEISRLIRGCVHDSYIEFSESMQSDFERSSKALLKDKFTESVKRINGPRTGKKAPQIYVHFPEIFEEALQDAGIRHCRINETGEDLLAYTLLFPSGCRMVVAIPMKPLDEKQQKWNENFRRSKQ